MANSGLNTNGSQFYIVQNQHLPKQFVEQMIVQRYPQKIIDCYKLSGGCPWLDQHYTVFGQVCSGLKVVDKIAQVKTDYLDRPGNQVRLERVQAINDIILRIIYIM